MVKGDFEDMCDKENSVGVNREPSVVSCVRSENLAQILDKLLYKIHP
jgi:hypothetical protein